MRRHAHHLGPFLSLSRLSRLSRLSLGLAASLLVAACTKQAPESEAPRAAEVPARRPVLDSAEPPGLPPPGSASASASASPSSSTSTSASASTAPPDDPPPHVKVATIGMHVGGGPYDEPTKEPIRRSVEPHFTELARCWKLVTKPQATDVGVDLVIEAGGGRARVSNPRTSVTSEGFVPCVVAFFEGVEFLKPANGKTVVSYSVRFTP